MTTRLQLSRYEREQRQRRIVVLVAAAVGLTTVALVAAAAIQIGVIAPSRAVANVGGQAITVQSLQKRMRLTQTSVIGRAQSLQQQIAASAGSEQGDLFAQFYQQQFQQVVAQGSAEAIAQSAYQSMVDEQLVRQEAARRSLTVAADDVQKELESSTGYYRATLTPFPTDPPQPTVVISGTPVTPPTAEPRLQPTSITEPEFKFQIDQRVADLKPLGYEEADLRSLVESDLLTQKLRDTIGAEVQKSAPHYQFDFVRFNVMTDALKAADRLSKGEIRFDALISETNAITVPTSIGAGQSVEWTSEMQVRNLYGPEVLDLLSYKALNAPTTIVTSTTSSSIYILLPKGRETRDLAENELEQAKRDKYDEWLNKARLDTNIVKKELEPSEFIPATVRTIAAEFIGQFGGQAGGLQQQLPLPGQ
jgi:hypothetical protein